MRYLSVLFCLVLTACSFFQSNDVIVDTHKNPVVQVYGKTLYANELNLMLPNNYVQRDSGDLKEFYINKWVERQLWLARKDSLNLSTIKDIERMVEKYREELYVYELQKQGFNLPVDTAVTQAVMQEYYDEYKTSFLLSETVIKGLLVKVSKDTPDLDVLKGLIKNHTTSDTTNLNEVCNRLAESCHLKDSSWVSFGKLLSETPFVDLKQGTKKPISGQFYVTSDEEFVYFLKIMATLKAGEIAPFTYEQGSIKELILHERRDQQKVNVGKLLYSEAKEQNEIQYY